MTTIVHDRSADRSWVDNAVRLIEADARRSADTHLLRFPLGEWARDAGIDLYLKDETTHITGSLKHRLARSLFLYGLCNGRIGPETTVVEASSGSTAGGGVGGQHHAFAALASDQNQGRLRRRRVG